jgi:hypothetical protein
MLKKCHYPLPSNVTFCWLLCPQPSSTAPPPWTNPHVGNGLPQNHVSVDRGDPRLAGRQYSYARAEKARLSYFEEVGTLGSLEIQCDKHPIVI